MDRLPPAVPRGLRGRAVSTLEGHWRADGYTSPNLTTYPWQWLWDSCFHALVWSAIGRPDRALAELDATLAPIDADGFVPHMRYQSDPTADAEFWGRVGTSSITQPPMFGHALAELHRAGVDLPAVVVHRAAAAFGFLFEQRDRTEGLVAAVHPWETGCDDSPRWDHWSSGPDDHTTFRAVKGDLVNTIRRTETGSPVGNQAFSPGSVGFNALIAFNARELAEVTGDRALTDAADALVAAIEGRWDSGRATWVDTGPHARGSGRIRTADSLLPVLVVDDDSSVEAAFATLFDPEALGGPWGPAGVDRREPTYDPDRYWRGPCWPQLAYLLWLAARRRTRRADADHLAASTIAGAEASELAEYWNPDTGAGLGAIPQSWTALVLLMAD